MQNTAYSLAEYKIIENEHGDLLWEAHIGLGSLKSGKCFINGNILFIKPSDSTGPGFLKGEFLDHLNKLPKWRKTKYYCVSYKIYQCKSGSTKPLSEAMDSRLQKGAILQEIGPTQKEVAKTTRKSVKADTAEPISYKLRRYEITEKNNGQLFWKSHSGLSGFKKGRCHIEGSILFLEPGKIERSGLINGKFAQRLTLLPDWDRTKYFCPSCTIYYSATGAICRRLGEDKDLKKDEGESVVVSNKTFGTETRIEPLTLNKMITKENLRNFIKFSKILVTLILKLLLGGFQIIFRTSRSLIGRWTRFKSWRSQHHDRYQLQCQLKLQEVPFNLENNQGIKVWDLATRVFHWTLVGCFSIAFIGSEGTLNLHVIFGYSVLVLVFFRILYGFVGTKHARFSDFLYPPAQIVGYLKGLLIGRPKHYIGHNPAGGFMIVILLFSLLSLTLTGLKTYGVKGHGLLARNEISFMTNAFADSNDKKNHDEHNHRERRSQENHRTEKNGKDESWKDVHETIAYFTLFLVLIHIMGVLVSSLVHRENMIKAMITGRKPVM
jgi:cytochrome b